MGFTNEVVLQGFVEAGHRSISKSPSISASYVLDGKRIAREVFNDRGELTKRSSCIDKTSVHETFLLFKNFRRRVLMQW